MRTVFADAFYFIARLHKRDQYHAKVLAFSHDLYARVVTTDWVLMEVADGLASSECRPRINDAIAHLRRSPVYEVIPASRESFDRALELYRRHSDKGWTLTDCTSFIVMQDRGLHEALTGDKHFEQAGFAALLK